MKTLLTVTGEIARLKLQKAKLWNVKKWMQLHLDKFYELNVESIGKLNPLGLIIMSGYQWFINSIAIFLVTDSYTIRVKFDYYTINFIFFAASTHPDTVK